jgi:hypothetical protein
VPDQQTRLASVRRFQEIYGSEYALARTTREKHQLAQRLLLDAAQVRDDSTDYFALLELCIKIASQSGDVITAFRAAHEMEQSYNCRILRIKLSILTATAGQRLSPDANEVAWETAMGIVDMALQQAHFEQAEKAHAAALAAARRSRDRRRIADTISKGQVLADAKTAHAEVVSILDSIDAGADDPEANLKVGSYYCFVKGQWDKGLVMLARGRDPRLASLAQRELNGPTSPEEQVALADRWWDLAAEVTRFRAAVRSRAVFWYTQAAPALPAGLLRAKVEMRAQQSM